MERYQKPVMEIVELEKVDVLTCSKNETLGVCSMGHTSHWMCKALPEPNSCHPNKVDAP